jgi:sigma-B regulation protein RsbU (phosphoserine phosphatase)
MPTRAELTVETKYRLLLQISHRIRDTLDLDQILDHMLDAVHSAVEYDAAGVFVLCEDLIPVGQRRPRELIAGVARRGFAPGPPEDDPMLSLGLGIVGDVIRTGIPAVIPDVHLDARYVCGRAATRSEIAVPIARNARTIGALNLESDRVDAFDHGDLEFLRFFADAVAIVIQRALLHRQLVDRQRLDDQLRLAQEVQAGLLPAQAPHLPGYALAGRCIPTFAIGGDCFDYFPLPDGRFAVLVADVAGKGIPAALVMASFRTLVRSHARRDPRPASLAEITNRRLPEHITGPTFVTAFYGVLDPATGDFTYVNCGHNPPLLVRHDGATEDLGCGGLPLGAFENSRYDQATVQLAPGDVIAIYTDGVVENDDDERGDFGARRLAELIVRHRTSAPQDIVDRVVAETRQYHGISVYPDDFTLLVMKRVRAHG